MDETIVLNECIVVSVNERDFILKNKKVTRIFDELKTKVVNHCFLNGKRSKIALEEFYCNPYKEESLLKLNYIDGISPGMIINCTITINGINSKGKSISPNLVLMNYTIHKDEYVFIDSDDDTVFNV